MDGIKAWFRGRNGFDALNYALLIFAVALAPWRFTRGFAIGFLALAVFRLLSRNVYRRQAENAQFMTLINMIKQRFNNWRSRRKNTVKHKPSPSWADKNYKVVKCPNCKQKLRLPRKKGKLRVHCKTCGEAFEIKT